MNEIKTTFQPKGQKVEKKPSGEITVETDKGHAQPIDVPQKTEFKGTTYSMHPVYGLMQSQLMRHFR